jgi:hypothetical protein
MVFSRPLQNWALDGTTAKRGSLLLELTKKVASLIKLGKCFGGAWSWKKGEESETGVLLVVEAMFCRRNL